MGHLKMKKLKFFSIRYRIMLLSFLLVSLTVCSLIYFTNVQMEQLFWEYVRLQPAGKQPGAGELDFLNSVHHSLIWVGLVFVLLGLAASFLFSRNITIPLRRLSAAAESIRRGSLKQQVPVTTSDEVGQLTCTFNKRQSGKYAGRSHPPRYAASAFHAGGSDAPKPSGQRPS